MSSTGIVYNQTWEDVSVDRQALMIGPSDSILAITSAGCNILSLSLERPHSITAVDSNPAQNHLLRLKIAAIQTLRYEDVWRLFGLGVHPEARRLYNIHMRPQLPPVSRRFWDRNLDIFSRGLTTVGALRSLRLLHKSIRLFCSEDRLAAFADMTSQSGRENYYRTHVEPKLWNRWTKRVPVWTMRLYGVHPYQISAARLQGIRSIADLYHRRHHEIFSSTSVKENYFWHKIFFGDYADPTLGPTYLQPGNFIKLREVVNLIRIVDEDIVSFLKAQHDHSFSRFNLSDVPEFLSRHAQRQLWDGVLRTAKLGARLLYRTFAPELHITGPLIAMSQYEQQESELLSRQELTASYGHIYVYTINRQAK